MTTIGRTMIRQRSVNMIGAGGNKTSAEALAWQAAVIANGGTVSAPRLAIVNSFIKAEKSAGTWALTDDYWGLWAENSQQALTSLKQLRLATAVNAPAFEVDRGYTSNGTTSNINSGFNLSTHFVAATVASCRLASYVRTNVFGSNVSTIGCASTAVIGMRLRPRGNTNIMSTQVSAQATATTILTVTTSVGYTAASRSGSSGAAVSHYKNGVFYESYTPSSFAASFPNLQFTLVGNNTNGTANEFYTGQVGFLCTGAALNATQEAAQYANVQAWAAAIGAAFDVDADAWAAQVVTNGGTVSAARLSVVASFIIAEKAAGTWALTDDYWPLWAENEPQALTSLKQRRLSVAVAAPAFVADRGYTSNGTTSYLNTGFIPSTHAVAMTGTSLRIATYDRGNVAATSRIAGCTNSVTQNLALVPRTGSSLVTIHANCQITTVATVPTSSGFTACSLSTTIASAYKNGALLEQQTPSVGSALPTFAAYIGCWNSAGTAASFRATQVGFVVVSSSLSPAQELAQYTNVQAWATAVGANV